MNRIERVSTCAVAPAGSGVGVGGNGSQPHVSEIKTMKNAGTAKNSITSISTKRTRVRRDIRRSFWLLSLYVSRGGLAPPPTPSQNSRRGRKAKVFCGKEYPYRKR